MKGILIESSNPVPLKYSPVLPLLSCKKKKKIERTRPYLHFALRDADVSIQRDL